MRKSMEQGGESDVKLSTLQKCSPCGTHANWMTVTSELAKKASLQPPPRLTQPEIKEERGGVGAGSSQMILMPAKFKMTVLVH